MQQLWAPWRGEIIQQKPPLGCIFCLFPAETGAEADRRNLIVARSERSFVILNRYPYNNGHLMVVPRRHTGDFASISSAEAADLNALMQRSTAVLNRAYRPEGMNLGMNLGKSAGAGIADHLHWHVVPRWVGDTNFMPVLADTKVMIEHLSSTFDTLEPLFREG
ncbi:MAG TPA: HIT domain-containing protein [Myxococcaceae bacterium]|nr:HIT domain-containing protein [Myxococcaceae bacterium]